MYLLTYHGSPNSSHPDFEEIAGAYINCWIEAETFEIADEIARREIRVNNYNILGLEEAYTITKEDYAEDKTGLEYFEQALIDKAVFVFYTYPVDELEKD